MFNIRVTKDGGPTGYGTSLLKENGQILFFSTREEAVQRAIDYHRRMNHPYATAYYTAEVIEVGHA